MTKQGKQNSTARKRHSQQYKTEALALAERVGVAAAAKQLGLHESQLYAWRSKARRHLEQGEAERQLAVERGSWGQASKLTSLVKEVSLLHGTQTTHTSPR